MVPLANELLFLLACLPARILLVYAALKVPDQYLQFLGYALLAAAVVFTYIYVTNKGVWWGSYSLIHAMLYLTAAVYLLRGDRSAWIPLAAEVVIGMVLFFKNIEY